MDRRPTLARRLALRFALTFLALIAVLGVLLDRTLERVFLEDLTRSLVTSATAVRESLPAGVEPQPEVMRLGRELGLRITLIRTDGVVVGDSQRDPSEIENHGDRPEVRAALTGVTGVATRLSETVGEPFRYVALPPRGGVLVRVALPLSIVAERLGRVRAIVATGAALAGVTAVLAAWLIARRVTRRLRRMTGSVERIAAGETDVRVERGDTAELDLLATTLNRMAQELGARIDQMVDDRRTRDLILSAMEEGVALVEPDDRLGYRNPAARRILGEAETSSGFFPHTLRQLVARARDGGEPVEEEIETGPPVRTLRASAIPVGRRVLVVTRDITSARRVEAMRRDFVANASHELKTPVASIQAVAETLGTALQDDPAAARDFSAKLQRETVRLGRLITDLLDLSRLESERLPAEEVRVDRVAAAGTAAVAERAEGIDLRTELEPCTVLGSAKDLAVLIANLLDNALRFTPQGGRVEMSVRPEGQAAVIEVRDSGIGIPRRDLPRIFERFYRVDPARSRATGGTGLGLAIAKHVAEEHGGRIEASSELGQGSTFRVTLPLHDPK